MRNVLRGLVKDAATVLNIGPFISVNRPIRTVVPFHVFYHVSFANTSMKNVLPYHAFHDRIRSDEQLAPQRKRKKQSTF